MRFSSQKLIFLVVLALFLFSAAFFADAFHARKLEINYPELPGLPKLESHTSLPNLIKYVFVFTVTIAGIIALGALVWAGFLFLMSGANPGLRATAKKKIAGVLWGILLLLGAYIFFNTLNPDLTLLRTPGTALGPISQPSISEPLGVLDVGVDLATLRYGGVVVYSDAKLIDGSDASLFGSQILLNNVTEFDDETWLGKGPKYIKILGKCAVSLFDGENYTPPGGLLSGPSSFFPSVLIKSLRFDNRECLGSSIAAYLKTGYHDNSGAFIYSDSDLSGDKLSGTGHSPQIVVAEDNIESVRFNRPDLAGFKVKFCEKKQMGKECEDVSSENLDETTITTLLGGIKNWDAFPFLKNDVSSFVFSGDKKIRQAGVVLYNKDDFSGISEIFITSDRDLENIGALGTYNIIRRGDEYTSSIRIVGEYIITLFDCKNYCQDDIPNGHFLKIYNNTQVPLIEKGHVIIGPLLPPTELGGGGYRDGGVLQLPKLSAFVHPGEKDDTPDDDKTWNDNKVKSIKIEVPKRIYDAQNLRNLVLFPCGDPDSDPDTPCFLP